MLHWQPGSQQCDTALPVARKTPLLPLLATAGFGEGSSPAITQADSELTNIQRWVFVMSGSACVIAREELHETHTAASNGNRVGFPAAGNACS